MTYDDLSPAMRIMFGCFEGYRRAGFRAEDIYCELNYDKATLEKCIFATIKSQGKEFRVNCGPLTTTESGAQDEYETAAKAIQAGTFLQADLDRIWVESPMYQNPVLFVTKLAQKGFKLPAHIGF